MIRRRDEFGLELTGQFQLTIRLAARVPRDQGGAEREPQLGVERVYAQARPAHLLGFLKPALLEQQGRETLIGLALARSGFDGLPGLLGSFADLLLFCEGLR